MCLLLVAILTRLVESPIPGSIDLTLNKSTYCLVQTAHIGHASFMLSYKMVITLDKRNCQSGNFREGFIFVVFCENKILAKWQNHSVVLLMLVNHTLVANFNVANNYSCAFTEKNKIFAIFSEFTVSNLLGKPVFGVADKASFKPISSATKTS